MAIWYIVWSFGIFSPVLVFFGIRFGIRRKIWQPCAMSRYVFSESGRLNVCWQYKQTDSTHAVQVTNTLYITIGLQSCESLIRSSAFEIISTSKRSILEQTLLVTDYA
jgi:hypothetical protein